MRETWDGGFSIKPSGHEAGRKGEDILLYCALGTP